MSFTRKKLFLFGFFALLLVGIPLTIFTLQKQQEVRSRAAKSTNLTFSPNSSATAPLTKSIGDDVSLDVMVDPGQNLVSFVKLEIQYDPDKLTTAAANAFQPNTTVFPSTIEGPVYTPGKIAVTLSVGSDPTKAVQTKVKAATFTFKALAATATGTPTLVTYSATTQVLSIGSTDQASENVLSSAQPATIVINGPAGTITPTVSITNTPTPTATATGTPTPTLIAALTSTPTLTPTPTVVGSTATPNVPPACSSLAVDRATTGTVPYAITFTANGTDSDGTVSKVTFNFGDGQVSDVTTGGGIGTKSVNTQIAHTYTNAGTYQATAMLTDSNNGVSTTGSCVQTITAEAAGSTGGTTSIATATPTIAATGSTEVIFGIGTVSLLLMIGGSLLFFIL